MKRNHIFLLFVLLVAVAAQAAKPAAPKFANADCLACHGDPNLAKDVNGKAVSLHVNEEKFKNSIHSSFSCTDCHNDVKDVPHEKPPAKPACATCHADEQAQYDTSLHAKAIRNGNPRAAGCVDCHGSPHEVVVSSDPASRVAKANVPKTCGACHSQKFVMESSGNSIQPVASYAESVHGKAVAAGSEKAAVCTDCHGAHNILAPGDPKSTIYKFNVPLTCGKCHDAVKAEFVQSIHGQALGRGNWQAPVCTDCHGIHLIKKHMDPTSTVNAQNLARATCAQCHEGVKLSNDFGVAGRRATTYLASYHGMASSMGSTVVANCASCHGVHNILPSSDPRSTISKQNLVKTCGQCHPGATANFAAAKVHLDEPLQADIGSKVVHWVRNFYLLMIVFVIGGMLLHNFLIWRKKAADKRNAGHRTVVRMKPGQRWQHLTLLTSFIVLVVTGFALKYPQSWFAGLIGMGESFRGILHRIAGTVLIGAGVYHLVYLIVSRDGRKLAVDLLPEPKDAFDVVAVLRYYLGLGGERPQFRRFNYAEKAEYWALVWGTLVMAVTGIMMWFKVPVGNLLPRWSVDVAMAVHFYEAILATLAIIVWHLYQVIFDPDVYPMNWAWYDGKMSLHHYVEEHPLDSEAILNASEAAGEAASVEEPKLAEEPAPESQSADKEQDTVAASK